MQIWKSRILSEDKHAANCLEWHDNGMEIAEGGGPRPLWTQATAS